MNKLKNCIIAIILALITIIFLWHKFLISGNTIVLLLLIIPFYIFYKNVIDTSNKRKFTISMCIAVIFSIIELICTSINTDYTLNHVIDKWILVNLLGYILIMWGTVSSIYTFWENKGQNSKELNEEIKDQKEDNKKNIIHKFLKSKYSFIIIVILIFIAWLPYFLRYYPGLFTNDSYMQVLQSLGKVELSNHHPIAHTGIISIFINIGCNIFKNINFGVALYSIFQMIMMAVMFTYVIRYLNQKNVPIIVQACCLLYYMFYPVHGLYSITMWKDILFSGLLPIYIIKSIELIYNTENFMKNKGNIIKYILISLLVILLRNNGLYIIILSMLAFIIALRKYWKKLAAIFIAIMAIYFLLKTSIFSILNIKEGEIRETLSIPLQQIARVDKYHKEELSKEVQEQINRFFKCDNIGEKYYPILSDSVKDELNEEYFKEHKIEFIKLWGNLLTNYFKDYVESFISNSYGYYYPEAKHWVTIRTVRENNLGISQQPIIDSELVTKIDSIIDRRDIPIISMFFSIGTAFWIIVTCLGYQILNKNYKSILYYIIIFTLWLTIVASPVFCEYRYAYAMFTSIPLFVSLNFIKAECQ